MARAVYDGTPVEEQFRLGRRVEDKNVLLLLTGQKIAATTPNPDDSCLGVAAAFPRGRYIHFVGNRVGNGRIITSNEVDPKLILSWLQACQSHHNGMCRLPALEETDQDIPSFRLIDVRNFCIVPASPTREYLILSYVWGNIRTCVLLQSNKQELMEKDGLLAHWNRIPLTIRDAITLTQKLGKQYLWVDSLCLVQDDPQDLMSGIRRMDTIYEQSVLTIVAAHGSDATAGLPGVRQNSRNVSQIGVDVSPMTKMVMYDETENFLKGSKYATRAWT
jgi:Heterokaryon incompatibility protein (HET)